MAWALQFDGVSAYCDVLNNAPVGIGETITIVAVGGAGNDNGYYRLAGASSNFNTLIEVRSDGVLIRVNDNSGNPVNENYTQPAIGEWFTLELTRDATGYDVFLDGGYIGRKSSANAFTVQRVGGFSSARLAGQIQSLSITGVLNLDATASDHSAGAQPILTDTVGGNNAQGFNFPTDGSAWVDLGGGTQESSVDFSVNKPVFTASIENINAGNQTAANFSVNKPLFSASIDNEAINNQVSVNYSTSKPVFFAAIENEQVNNSSDVDFTLNKPSFNVQINNSAGTNTSSINYSIKKPIFNIDVNNSTGTNLSNVSFTVKQPIFSVSVLNVNGPNESAVNFAINKPMFSVNVQNGEIVVKFNPETNYSQEYLSTNYNQPYLSTNYTQD